jgi:hypothetical protein
MLKMASLYVFPILSILFLILGVACLIAAIIIFIINRFTRVSRNNVPVIKGQFAVVPNSVGTVAIDCGDSANQPCIFDVANVNEAIDHCNTYKTGCKSFMYDYTVHQVKILTDAPVITSSTSSDVYHRQ